MDSLRHIRMLARYSAWAHARLFETLSGLPAPEIEAPGGGAGSILKTLNHMHVVDRIWQAHLEGREHGYAARNTDVLPPLPELAAAQRELDEWYVAYAQALSPESCAEVVHFKFVGGGPGAMTRGDMLLHVVNHKTYHRGYVAEMLYRGGRKPPTMDLPVYLRDVVQPAG